MYSKATYLPSTDPGPLDDICHNWHQAHPDGGVLCLVAEADRENIPDLQACCKSHSLPLVGAVFPELIVENSFHRKGVILLLFDQMPPHLITEATNREGHDPAITLAAHVAEESKSLFLIFDGMIGNIASLLDDIYFRLGDRVSYWGVNAGSETFSPIPCLFDNQQIKSDAILCLYLPDPQTAELAHGYRAPDEDITATSTDGNCITTIDWRPAFDVYAERISKAYDTEINPDNFYQLAVHFPLGILRMDNEILVRIPVALGDDGAIYCVGEIPQNALLTLLDASHAGSAGEMDMGKRFQDERQLLLGFYCAGRRMHLGIDQASEEIAAIQSQANKSPLMGALSLGEIGSTQHGSYPLFHNACIVIKALEPA